MNNSYNSSTTSKMSNIFLSNLHKSWISMNLPNYHFQLFHILLFVFHNRINTNQIYKTFEEVQHE